MPLLDPTQCRAKADHCQEEAEACQNSNDKTAWLAMADDWLLLAHQRERTQQPFIGSQAKD
jgi:hypothetical protein